MSKIRSNLSRNWVKFGYFWKNTTLFCHRKGLTTFQVLDRHVFLSFSAVFLSKTVFLAAFGNKIEFKFFQSPDDLEWCFCRRVSAKKYCIKNYFLIYRTILTTFCDFHLAIFTQLSNFTIISEKNPWKTH